MSAWLWPAALGAQTKFGNAGHPEIDRITDALAQALAGRLLTREELARAVAAITGEPSYGDWVRSSWGSYLKAASFRGHICFAPSAGSAVRFTSPQTWVPGGIEPADPRAGLRDVTRRFLHTYGPATAEDLARWWVGPPSTRQIKLHPSPVA